MLSLFTWHLWMARRSTAAGTLTCTLLSSRACCQGLGFRMGRVQEDDEAQYSGRYINVDALEPARMLGGGQVSGGYASISATVQVSRFRVHES